MSAVLGVALIAAVVLAICSLMGWMAANDGATFLFGFLMLPVVAAVFAAPVGIYYVVALGLDLIGGSR